MRLLAGLLVALLLALAPALAQDKPLRGVALVVGQSDYANMPDLRNPENDGRDMTRLLGILRERNPEAKIFLSNCPMIKLSPAIPQPIKFILWELSKLHDANIKEMTAAMDRVYYYHQPRHLDVEGFFADGIHPSEKGYSDWTEAMMEFFDKNYKW